jgi:hypothetical protein
LKGLQPCLVVLSDGQKLAIWGLFFQWYSSWDAHPNMHMYRYIIYHSSPRQLSIFCR